MRSPAPGGPISQICGDFGVPMAAKRQPQNILAVKALKDHIEKYGESMKFSRNYWNAMVDPGPLETPATPEPKESSGNDADNPIGSYLPPLRGISSLEADLNILIDDLGRGPRPTADVFSVLLQVFLHEHDVPIPKGVFKIDLFSAGPGRPSTGLERLQAILAFQKAGRYSRAARELFPEDYEKDPKKVTNRVRQRIKYEPSRKEESEP